MRMASLATALALLAPLAMTLISAGCSSLHDCTLIGFDNGLHVDIEVPTTPAAYRVEVDADGEVLCVRYEVTSQGIRCLECDMTGESLEVWDSFSPSPQSLAVNIGRADGEGGPRIATVRVFRGDALAAQARFEPRYTTNEPNGPGCGEHVFASAALLVP